MKLTSRELVLAFATVLVVVLALTFMIGRPYLDEWRQLAQNWGTLQRRITVAEKTISQKDRWYSELAVIQKDLPRYEMGKDITADLLKMLEQTANVHGLTLLKRDPGEEKSVGQVYEFSITCTWEGTLNSLVHFLYAIQSKGAILDIRQLTVSPDGGSPDRLKGGFTVDAAYTREPPAGG